MGTSLLRYLELFCNLSNTSHARRTTQTSTAKDIFPQLEGTPIQTPFLASIQRRSCAQVNESKQLLGRTRPPLPQFQWWLLQFQTSKLRCQQHWNWGPGLRNTGTSKLHSHRPLLRHQDATLDRVLKEGLKTLRLRIVKPRWNFGGTAAFCPYQ